MNSMVTGWSTELALQRDQLIERLRSYGPTIVAFSGGIDSTVVAKAARLALGDDAMAVTADSPSVARAEIDTAIRMAKEIGIDHRIVQTEEFDNPDYARNDGSRCYHCKSELYDRIFALMDEFGERTICSGANLDDQGDYRPGLKAAAERAVRHPLQEVGLAKADVRALAKAWGLPTWDKPASPCLSSRIAPGLEATRERTEKIEKAEQYLRELGLRDCRVRLHPGELARIEVPIPEIAHLADDQTRDSLVRSFRAIGFRFITLDLEGFRSGNLNELVDLTVRHRMNTRRSTSPVEKPETTERETS